jgi:hypothetical protein
MNSIGGAQAMRPYLMEFIDLTPQISDESLADRPDRLESQNQQLTPARDTGNL